MRGANATVRCSIRKGDRRHGAPRRPRSGSRTLVLVEARHDRLRCVAARWPPRSASRRSPLSPSPPERIRRYSPRGRSSPRWGTPRSTSIAKERATHRSPGSTTGLGSPTPPAAPSTGRATLRDRRLLGDVSESAPDGTLDGDFASGLGTRSRWPSTTKGTSTSARRPRPHRGVLRERPADGEHRTRDDRASGDDWIAWAPTRCTFTTPPERPNLSLRHVHQQEPNFTSCPSPPTTLEGLPVQAFELQILPDGNVFVAESDADIPWTKTATCSRPTPVPPCRAARAALRHEPRPRRHLVLDRGPTSGDVWEVNIATGAVEQQIDTHVGFLYGLSVDDQIEVAAAPPVATAAPTSLAVQPVTGNFSSPTPVSAVLTTPRRMSPSPTSRSPSPERFRDIHRRHRYHRDRHLDITPREPSSSYTLTASFSETRRPPRPKARTARPTPSP